MELRVWTDGIERVVCGVTDVTTCRDVIVALARTVGKTGRYWLIETCHGRQRRLPAAERLLARYLTCRYQNSIILITSGVMLV